MAGNIKGITIQIGADTKPLEKSLEGVNKNARAIQAELRQVDRLLKLDPSNVDLVSQKQKLLSDAVSNTKDKLAVLKEAQMQVEQQFKKGEIGEDKYRALQREVISTEQNLKSLEKQLFEVNSTSLETADGLGETAEAMKNIAEADIDPIQKALGDINENSKKLQDELKQVDELLKLDPKNTELLAQKQKLLTDAVKNTNDKLEALKESEKEVQNQFKKGEIAEEQYRALKREIVKTESELRGFEKQVKEVNKAFNETNRKIEDFGNKATKAGEKFAPISTGAGVLLAGVVANTHATADYVQEMGKLETAFEMSGKSADTAKETYDALFAIIGESDRAVETANHLAKLTDTQEELTEWTTISTGVFATFGDSLPIENLAEAANETAKTGELVGSLADALNWAGVHEDDFKAKLERTTSEQQRQQLITETLMGLYSGAAEKYRATNEELIRTNEIQSSVNDSMADFGEIMRPITNDVMESFAETLRDFVDWLSGLDEGTLKVITAITGLVAVISPLLLLVGGIAKSIGDVMDLFDRFGGPATKATVATEAVGKAAAGAAGGAGLLGTALEVLAGPVGIAIAAVVGFIGVLNYLYETNESSRKQMDEMWEAIGDAPQKALDDIKKDLQEWKEIGEKIVTGIFDGIKGGWDKIEDWINDKFGWLDDKLNDWGLGGGTTKAQDAAGGIRRIDGSHYNGLSYVPFDGYIAQLHQGERVLTANENSTYNNQSQYGDMHITVQANNIKEINDLIEMAQNARRKQRMGVI